MLATRHRLPASILFSYATTVKTPYFICKVQKQDLPLSRFGFIVSKRIDKRASARNRIKRVVRSCVEERLSEIKPGYDMLFILKQAALAAEREDICKEVINLLRPYLQTS